MKSAPLRSRTHPSSERDVLLLHALARYYYLTAAQLARLHYGKSDNFVSQRLAEFTRGGLAVRQELSLPRMHGTRPYVYSLGNRGRRYLEALGAELPRRSHHAPDQPRKFITLDHTLCVNDFLISLELLCRAHEGLAITNLVHERAFQRHYDRVRVRVGDDPPETIAAQPDAWIELLTPRGTVHWLVEVDLGTETQPRWRRKVRGLLAWLRSAEFHKRFGDAQPLIPVVSIAGAPRRQDLERWTAGELGVLKQERMQERFGFTDLHPGQVAPATLFHTPAWHTLTSVHPVSLVNV